MFISKLLTSILGLTFLLCTNANALERALTDEEAAAINNINRHHSTVKQMVGRFIQTDSRGQYTEGIFYLHRPNKIRFRYAPPSHEEVISTGKGFYVINRKERSKFAYPQQHVPLRQFLGDEINLFDAGVDDVMMTAEHITITISDDTPAGPVSVDLTFDLENSDLQRWSLSEPNGNRVNFTLFDTTTEIDIPKAYFYLPDYQ